jgi:ketopantoate hydroxymethyltransferase
LIAVSSVDNSQVFNRGEFNHQRTFLFGRNRTLLLGANTSEITRLLSIPTIGIGAGAGCSAQVLVLHDMLGIYPGFPPRYVKNFMQGVDSIQAAIENYVREVKAGDFPAPEHMF